MPPILTASPAVLKTEPGIVWRGGVVPRALAVKMGFQH